MEEGQSMLQAQEAIELQARIKALAEAEEEGVRLLEELKQRILALKDQANKAD